MTMRYLLDTDHVSLLQRRQAQVVARLIALPPSDVAVTIITVDEQFQGRLAVIRQAKTQLDAARGYERLYETLRFYTSVTVALYDAAAVARFDELRRQGVRVGTQDLRIAAIALTQGATVVTRNVRDFGLVPGLLMEDWSHPAGH
jgi:tRNA(fMet)-specific endonuclease VapC